MPAKLETIDLKLNNTNKWEMKVGSGPWQLPADSPNLEVAEDVVGVFSYRIIGSPDVTFNAVDPFVQKADANPQMPDFNDQFVVLGKGTRELTIIDVNGLKAGDGYDGGNYTYALKFTGPPGSTIPELDPIITNMGCCNAYKISGMEAVGYSLLLAAAGAVAALGYRKWRGRRSLTAAGAGSGKAQKGS